VAALRRAIAPASNAIVRRADIFPVAAVSRTCASPAAEAQPGMLTGGITAGYREYGTARPRQRLLCRSLPGQPSRGFRLRAPDWQPGFSGL